MSAEPPTLSDLDRRYRAIEEKIHSVCEKTGRNRRDVTLIAVSKTHPISAIAALYRLGHRDFGENYAQELTSKTLEAQRLGLDEIRWHYIGHLQSNKVKKLLPTIHTIHTLDRPSLAEEIQKHAHGLQLTHAVKCMIEVNIDQEPQKSGALPDQLATLIREIKSFPSIHLAGLMCIPAAGGDSRSAFESLASLSRAHRDLGLGPDLSMGMTADFEAAISCGATHIRIGTAIFGDRPSAEKPPI